MLFRQTEMILISHWLHLHLVMHLRSDTSTCPESVCVDNLEQSSVFGNSHAHNVWSILPGAKLGHLKKLFLRVSEIFACEASYLNSLDTSEYFQ
jgi:hypothetical protein